MTKIPTRVETEFFRHIFLKKNFKQSLSLQMTKIKIESFKRNLSDLFGILDYLANAFMNYFYTADFIVYSH